jgi:signal transduction histidine kinase
MTSASLFGGPDYEDCIWQAPTKGYSSLNRSYAYSPDTWLPVATTSLLILLAIYAWRRREVPGALPFAVGSLFGAIWAVGSFMEIAAVDLPTKFFWVRFQAAWQLPAVTAMTCFVLDYTWPGRWLTRRNLVLLSVAPLLYIGLVLTNGLHQLVWHGFTFDGVVIPLRGWVNWLFIAYGYGLGIVNILLFAWLLLRSPSQRLPVAIMLLGQIGTRVIYLLEMARFIQADVPLDVVILACVDLVYAVALFGFRIFDPVQLARHIVISQMREGMLVLDPEGRVTSLNPAAQAILRTPADLILGRRFQEVVPEYSEADGELPVAETEPIEIYQEIGTETRCYSLESSLLKDWRGLEVGRLLLVHDVTGQKLAQARLVRQQRALAMLQEREQLSRELHDSLGQAFAFVSTQGQTVRRLLDRGDVSTADEYVGRLVEVAREANVDIRESILALRVTVSERGLFPALTEYLVNYEKNYGILTELEKPETFVDGVFEPLIEAQLLRIVQEALTNVRKHAQANCVRVAFAAEDGCARVTVQDDGQGFDPGVHSNTSGDHVGLRVMRERAEEVGGSLFIQSRPGQGTVIGVQVPLVDTIYEERSNDD